MEEGGDGQGTMGERGSGGVGEWGRDVGGGGVSGEMREWRSGGVGDQWERQGFPTTKEKPQILCQYFAVQHWYHSARRARNSRPLLSDTGGGFWHDAMV